VNALPTASITASGSKTFCQGDSVTLTSSSANAYLWNTGETSQAIKIKASGSFSVKITDNNACSNTSSIASVVVNALPTASITASGSKTFCDGDSVTLTSSSANAYLWSNGSTSQAIKVKASGSFSVKITDNNACSNTSATTLITVNALPIAIVTSNKAKTFCQGDSVLLTASIGNAYLWSNGATNQTIAVLKSGNYSVVVTDTNACSNTSSIETVLVNALPVAAITANGALTFCKGDSVTLAANPANSYLWNTGEVTAEIKIKASGSYTVTITDNNNCSSTSSITPIVVNPLPLSEITAKGSTSFCEGDSVTLTASIANVYLWSTNESSPTITVKNSGQFNVIVTDVNGCSAKSNSTMVQMNKLPLAEITVQQSPLLCDGDSVILTSSAGQTYLWNNGVKTPLLIVKQSGLYHVTITDGNGCSATTKNINVGINKPIVPVITAMSSNTFCKGDSVILKSSIAKQYTWNNLEIKSSIVAKSSGVYAITTVDTNGCTASSLPLVVKVNELPSRPTIQADKSTEICEGDTLKLFAGNYSAYLWSTNQKNSEINVLNAGTYAVLITDINGCKAISYPLTVTVNSLPKVIITPDGPTTFCEGGSVVLSANVASTYLWNNNEQVQNILIDASGVYTVRITDYKNCSNISDPITVVVNPIPLTPIISTNKNILTCNISTGIQWYFNGVAIPGANSPQYTMTENGEYTVEVSNGSCSSLSEIFVCTYFKNTAIVSVGKLAAINVYPNPTIGPLSIVLEGQVGVKIIVCNAIGEIIYNEDFTDKIDLTGNSLGVYFVTVFTNNGHTTHKVTLLN
ncbi:T9SS type A sorting domain-containing protein, partial [Methylotenera sp.]|uniref:T9SS type A sorting domain-containing protein n=1 Tax=Methylotenera sp. TaxID=2051956 RepID=UPI00248749A8